MKIKDTLISIFPDNKLPVIFLFFLLMWFGILTLTGTLFSGYHFIDDHGIFKESQDVAHTTILREANIFKRNLTASTMRFRPFYWFHRRMMLAVLGTDFTALSIYIGFLAVFTSFFLFLFMRKTGFSTLESVLFVCLTLLGEQAAVWWMLGTGETLGMLLFSLALLFMALSVFSNRKKILSNVLFVIFTILASWTKESFILMIPALIFLKLWLTYQKEEKPSCSSCLRGENIVISVVLLLVCIVELIHILRNVGTTGVVYAGYEGFTVTKFLKILIQMTMSTHGWVILIQLVLIGIVYYVKSKKHKITALLTPLHTLLWPVILAGLIVVPQVALYMKSGIQERYLLPGAIGYTFLMVVLLRYVRLNTLLSRELKWKAKEKRPQLVVLILLIIVALLQLRVTRYTAIGFARDGQHTNAWLHSIQQNTQPQDLVLVITRMKKHYEASISLKTYMDFKMKRKNTLFSPVTLDIKPSKHIFWKQLNNDFYSRFPGFRLQDPGDRDCVQTIIIFPGLEKRFLDFSAPWFKPAQFKRYTNDGGYVSYYKKRNLLSTGVLHRTHPRDGVCLLRSCSY
ncbi:MAG: hypothetical protein GTO45_17275 [Candidatus Aminicenantes bacterium]|nr:hypothetical protein [Candidatus Aminicenantes bacterium]NIM80528.1 hypothetical protein [Candidatus Aminicenantes bacterium]NIN19884.1 hypothetical protein [Candidatus Aminicenantes bacterium]NIN43760.1 hypothetical protein [Candidatus Aminicenantes bacterium]NIN86510.1 hypothetical protein [Candidatus Aminicenantes bacterium]